MSSMNVAPKQFKMPAPYAVTSNVNAPASYIPKGGRVATKTDVYKARNHASIVINGKTDFAKLYPRLLEVAVSYKDQNLPCPAHREFYKPCTQLTNVKDFMGVLPQDMIPSVIDALQFVDAAWNIVHWDTRGANVYDLINDSMFNNCLIGYEHTAFGTVQQRNGANKWSALYQSACSMSNLRHVCKKAAKLLFTYYLVTAAVNEDPSLNDHEDVQYVIGAVQYAIDTYNFFTRDTRAVRAYFAYVWTLATFFNGLHAFDTNERDSAIPCRYVFANVRKYRGLDTFTKVNNAVVKKFFASEDGIDVDGLFPEDGFNCAFEFHAYDYPQCATPIKREDGVTFYDPHDVRTDIPSTKAFINTMKALKDVLPTKDFRQVLATLDGLDKFELEFLVDMRVQVDCTPNPYYETLAAAEQAAKGVPIPDDVKNDSVWFSCMVVTGKDANGRNVYELYLVNRLGDVYDSNFNLIKKGCK